MFPSDMDVSSSAIFESPQATQENIGICESGVSAFLEKKGDFWWNTRWCVLECSSNRLTYYENRQKNDGDNVQKGEMVITEYWDIPDRPGMRIARFDIMGVRDGGKVVYAMAAPNSEQKRVWMNRLALGLGPPSDLTKHPRAPELG
jgi:hypothetical protein